MKVLATARLVWANAGSSHSLGSTRGNSSLSRIAPPEVLVCGQFAFHSTAEYPFYQPANNHHQVGLLTETLLTGMIRVGAGIDAGIVFARSEAEARWDLSRTEQQEHHHPGCGSSRRVCRFRPSRACSTTRMMLRLTPIRRSGCHRRTGLCLQPGGQEPAQPPDRRDRPDHARLEDPFCIQAMKGIHQAIVALDYDLIAFTSGSIKKHSKAEREQHYVSLLNGSLTDGIVVVTPAATSFPQQLPSWRLTPTANALTVWR